MKDANDVNQIIERKLHILEGDKPLPRRRSNGSVYATIGSDIECDKEIFDSYSYDGWQSIHHDLLILCAAVEYADRRWARSVRQWARRFHITVPVMEISTWQDKNVERNLRETLRHITGDEWRVSFVRFEGSAADKPRQRPLPFSQPKEFAIAYSEGLDSFCVSGLYNKEDDVAVRVRVAKHKQHRRKDERPFDRLPFQVRLGSKSHESSARSRGFKFAAITAIAAHLSKVSRIIVPESGQGALGPVLLPLWNIYPDYRNHPTFFRRMERFIHALLGVELRYEQPRLWCTKGETIADFLAIPGIKTEQVIKTRSCWQKRANVGVGGKRRQCGVCAACLLRRMSLQAARVDEPSEAYAVANLKAEQFSDALPQLKSFKATATLFDYGYMGARHLHQLAEMSNELPVALRPHVFELAQALGTSTDEVQKNLRHMLLQHADEWAAFLASQGKQSFLEIWTKGGRHG
ncbi:7-cyano-7-deazaguanine synthase [Elongatibacter sediminis]|uniref:7-cyano-7-deazaguanine synthase n=1 Tax=Elongatibacter sediminis TaxID=3119006 RepID=A0AAW9RKE4_9GAMM